MLNINMVSENERISITDSGCPLLLEKDGDIMQSSMAPHNARRNGTISSVVMSKMWRIIWLSVYILLVHGALLLTYLANSKCHQSKTTAGISFCKQELPLPQPIPNRNPAPALNIIRHEIRTSYPVAEGDRGEFYGPPSPESNLAWDSLVRGTNLHEIMRVDY